MKDEALSMEEYVRYHKIELEEYQPELFSEQVTGEVKEGRESNMIPRSVLEREDKLEHRKFESRTPPISKEDNGDQNVLGVCHQKEGKFFYYDTTHSEGTGAWIPVSVPPRSEGEQEEWNSGLQVDGGCFPYGDLGWNQFKGENKEMTMWDVFGEMLVAARGKVNAIASGDINRCRISWISSHLLEQAWQEMAQTLSEANFGNIRELLEAEPPKWLPDSSAAACMLCNVRFHPIMCSRHHCRFCGGIFCNDCSKGRSLLPTKFRTGNPQRVCDVCCVRLESIQSHMMEKVSRAAQLLTHDQTDFSTVRSWLNFPWGQSIEYEIYKAANIWILRI